MHEVAVVSNIVDAVLRKLDEYPDAERRSASGATRADTKAPPGPSERIIWITRCPSSPARSAEAMWMSPQVRPAASGT